MDAQRFRLAEKALTGSPAFRSLDSRQMRDALRKQFHLLMVDEEAAITALPRLVPAQEDRVAVLDLIDKAAAEIGGLNAEQSRDVERLRGILSETASEPRTGGQRRRPPPEGREQRPLH